MSIDQGSTPHHLTQNPETQLPQISTPNTFDVIPLDGSHENIPHDEVPPLALFNLPDLVVDAQVDESTTVDDTRVDTDVAVETEEASAEAATEDPVEDTTEERTDELDATQEFLAITAEIDDSNDIIDDTATTEAEVVAVIPVEETADVAEEPVVAAEVATIAATEEDVATAETASDEPADVSDTAGAVATEQSTDTATLEELLTTSPAPATQEQPTSVQPETKRPWGKIAAIGATVVGLVAAGATASLLIFKPKEEQQPTQGASAVPGTSAQATPSPSAQNSVQASATETQIAAPTAAETSAPVSAAETVAANPLDVNSAALIAAAEIPANTPEAERIPLLAERLTEWANSGNSLADFRAVIGELNAGAPFAYITEGSGGVVSGTPGYTTVTNALVEHSTQFNSPYLQALSGTTEAGSDTLWSHMEAVHKASTKIALFQYNTLATQGKSVDTEPGYYNTVTIEENSDGTYTAIFQDNGLQSNVITTERQARGLTGDDLSQTKYIELGAITFAPSVDGKTLVANVPQQVLTTAE